jgi:methionyl-tRNA formyltransferase
VRTVYLGTSGFAAAVLRRLADSPHRPQLVVTRPDARRGRGRRLGSPPVADAARELGLALDQPRSVNAEAVRGRIAAARPEIVCVCAYGALLHQPLLSEHELLNVHPSLLPRWRGAAPIERALEAGDESTGVSIMRPTAELDAGPVCLAAEEPIHPDDDFGSLSARLEALGGELLVRALDERPPCREQPAEGVTLAPRIAPAERELGPADGAVALERRVRALTPHIGAYVVLADGVRLGVRRARALPGAPDPPPPGALAARDGRLLLGTPDGALDLLEVQPAGGRAMDAPAFLRGRGAAFATAA